MNTQRNGYHQTNCNSSHNPIQIKKTQPITKISSGNVILILKFDCIENK